VIALLVAMVGLMLALVVLGVGIVRFVRGSR
jgi:hypothetical protein